MTRGDGTTSRAVKKPQGGETAAGRTTGCKSSPATSSLDDLQKQLEVGTRKLNVELAQQAATAGVLA